ncbi:neutral and basic amino acid transport protein rBAT-like [Chelonus insularis]|uniref:neutral and basic amino acid transport protein rBAT-like n=1 Tax=Chelonus insularis TaxID=460826 RepID=UPI001589C928|nr:neutral and basic amino acid transport protein rBAT-like [Chelonus insularis]XP_034944369.1 neutral and basic amino acid transport protein rBAT-like [Chelonus insularis]XP_034944370.1 neutral and basic amino acid transport protein rBAT-like [Chelonus insularis]
MDKHLAIDSPSELLSSSSAKPPRLFIKNSSIQDEEESDCPLLTPSPPPGDQTPSDQLETPESTMFDRLDNNSPAIEEIKSAVVNALTINNANINNSKINNDEASSRDPMVESSSSEESRSLNKEPVCTQLLTQLNTAYQHLAPDAQAIFYSQENGGKAPMVGIQVIMPKSPKDFAFTQWNWPKIRRICFWLMIGLLSLVTTFAIRGIVTMPRRCDPPTEWWQGKLFYEIFPASFQDSSNVGDGIGDLRGISMRLGYLKSLGVKTIRLNSIFQATHYPEHYLNIKNLTSIDDNLGTMADFTNLVDQLHRNDINLVLDIPIHAYVSRKSIGNNPNFENEKIMADYKRISREVEARDDNLTSSISNSSEKNAPKYERYTLPNSDDISKNSLHEITLVLTFWRQKNVDGFYLKGLEHYVNDSNFMNFLNHWRDIMGPQRILMCNWKVLEVARKPMIKEKIMEVMDLVDVTLKMTNGTKAIQRQVEDVMANLFIVHEDPSKVVDQRMWVHWSVGNVETKRIASCLSSKNATKAAIIFAMMLPGTPSIFYGDEIGMRDCKCEDHTDLENLHNLSPMIWSFVFHNKTEQFSSSTVMPWIPSSPMPLPTSMSIAVPQMMNLRQSAAPIYVEAALKHDHISVNCEIRYVESELIIIERWYPRQNTYILVANFGNNTQNRDFSSLYYEGEIVVGPIKRLNDVILFKEFIIAPGDAYVIKLKK